MYIPSLLLLKLLLLPSPLLPPLLLLLPNQVEHVSAADGKLRKLTAEEQEVEAVKKVGTGREAPWCGGVI